MIVIARSDSDEAIHSFAAQWIASRSLSSGGACADLLARNDGGRSYARLRHPGPQYVVQVHDADRPVRVGHDQRGDLG
jgi:hypothetical protein